MAQKVTFYCENLNSIGVIVFELCALQLFGRCSEPRFFGADGKNLIRFFLILVPKDAELPDLTITYYFGLCRTQRESTRGEKLIFLGIQKQYIAEL